jgi:TonB family protein
MGILFLVMVVSNFVCGAPSQNKQSAPRRYLDGSEGAQKAFVEPQLTKRVEANYPGKARSSRIKGLVVLEFTVDEGGNIAYVRALTGHHMLRDAATEALRQWVFEPARSNGAAVKAVGVVTFCFSARRRLSTSRHTFNLKECCRRTLQRKKDSRSI